MKTVLHTEASPGLGGQEIRTLNEARWTAERGWRVMLACQPEGGLHHRAREAGLEAVPVRMRGAWDAAAVLVLLTLIRRARVDLVHTHSSVDGWVGGVAGRLAGVPVLRTRHVSIPIRRGWNPVYTRLADRIVTSGEAIRAMVVAAGVPASRVIAIPAGVVLADFAFRGTSEAAKASLGLAGPVIGSVAMFRGSKGHAHIIEAFARLRQHVPGARLLLVGDGIRRASVEQLVRDRGLSGCVVITGFRSDVPALLAAMDCFVLASIRTEGVPQSLLQAFAAGVPVVASAVGGIPEIVRHGVTGLLVPAEDSRALAAAIREVLDDQPAARHRARAARQLVEEQFSHDRSMDRLLTLYDELIGAGSRRSSGTAAV